MKTFSNSLTAALIVFSIAAAHAQNGEQQPRTISTSGDAAIYVQPDEALLTFGIVTVKPALEVARAENETSATSLAEAINGLGIEPRYVATDQVAVRIIYDTTHGERQTKIFGYRVERTYMITLKDVSKLQTVTDTVMASGANIFEGVQFRTSDLRKHRDNARTMAIKAAKEKAVALAGALSAGVGEPRSISEDKNYAGMWYGGGRRGNEAMFQNAVQEVPSTPIAEAGTLPLGQIAINSSVSVTFDLLPGQVNQ